MKKKTWLEMHHEKVASVEVRHKAYPTKFNADWRRRELQKLDGEYQDKIYFDAERKNTHFIGEK